MKKLLFLFLAAGLIICQQIHAEKSTPADLDFVDKVDDGIGYMKTIKAAIKADSYSEFRTKIQDLKTGKESETIAEAKKKLVKLEEFVDNVKEAARQRDYATFKEKISVPLIGSGKMISADRSVEDRVAHNAYSILQALIRIANNEDTFERFIVKLNIVVIAHQRRFSPQ